MYIMQTAFQWNIFASRTKAGVEDIWENYNNSSANNKKNKEERERRNGR